MRRRSGKRRREWIKWIGDRRRERSGKRRKVRRLKILTKWIVLISHRMIIKKGRIIRKRNRRDGRRRKIWRRNRWRIFRGSGKRIGIVKVVPVIVISFRIVDIFKIFVIIWIILLLLKKWVIHHPWRRIRHEISISINILVCGIIKHWI